ncbi:hypothetical protein [Streptomyces sp. NPDC088725]|uniref:hypothetical protein n=1 Tax=Streptomyces sp. NPDC088725 TaxID=3365873 RepID=UPI0038150450
MTSEARGILSGLSEAFGADGKLRVPKAAPGIEGAEILHWSVLDWPPCECGSPKCPDAKAPATPTTPAEDGEEPVQETEQPDPDESPTMRKIREQMRREDKLKRRGGY